MNYKAAIEICGGIASGKTTLASLMPRIGAEISIRREDFQANPFWKAFYADPIRTAFETEVTFLLQHYHDIKLGRAQDRRYVCDFSLYLDLAYARVTLQGERLALFERLYRELRGEVGCPDLLIYLKCDCSTELARIRARGRAAETSISADYLMRLSEQLDLVLSGGEHPGRVLMIDSGSRDFAHGPQEQALVLDEIRAAIGW